MQKASGEKAKMKAGVLYPQQSCHCATRWESTQTRQAKAQGKQKRKGKQRCKMQANESQKRKPESSVPSGVATVVIPKFRSSMHDAKARVHQSELGSLLVVGPEEGYST